MYKNPRIKRIISLVLLMCFTFSVNLSAQQTSEKESDKSTKKKIVFQKDTGSTAADSLKALKESRIIFKKNTYSQTDVLKLVTTKTFEKGGQRKDIGENGQNIILAMGDNQEAIDMVNGAYKTRKSGKALMVVGVIAALATLIALPVVELGEQDSDSYTTTYYFLPFVAVGTILGGIGFTKYHSLEGNLHKAVKVYNKDLQKEGTDEDNSAD
ncbi:MAG: hypothetical protein KOO63_12655 [Bacteroidales bacterium]|nr:hypothetical protein [Candidatus Latescibacterota bacterium]